jgi:DNA polymerase (family X)
MTIWKQLLLEFMYADATEKAEKVIQILKPYVSRIAIGGSLARKHEDVGDVDLIAISKGDNIKEALKKNPRISDITGGEQNVNFKYGGIGFNLWLTPEKSFEATWLHFSWGKAIIRAKILAKKKGYKLTRYGLFRDEKFITGKAADIFKLVGMSPKKDIGIGSIA